MTVESEGPHDEPQNAEPQWDNPRYLDLTQPTAEEWEAVQTTLTGAINNALPDPLQTLSAEQHETLRRVAYVDRALLLALEGRCRTLMTNAYDDATVRRFSLRQYAQMADAHRRHVEREQETLARRARAQAQGLRVVEGGRAADQPRTPAPERTGPLSVDDMLGMHSPLMNAKGHLLRDRRGRLWYDSFYGKFFTDWGGDDDDRVQPVTQIEERFLRKVHTWLMARDGRLGKTSLALIEQAVAYVCELDERNEPQEWLRGLQWDGEERLKILLPRAFGTVDDRYHQDAGTKWLMGIVRRAQQPGCEVHTMLVFHGAQGIGKSRAIKIIGGKWYATINVSAEGKDFEQALRGVLVGEVAELDAIANRKAEQTRVKTLLTTSHDHYRPSYGRTTITVPRTCVLVGSTNDWSWHKDDTGGRRFWPVNVPDEIDLTWLEQNREQLFAEAKVRVERGEDHWTIDQEEHARLLGEHHIDAPWMASIRPIIDQWTLPPAPVVYDGWNGVEPLSGQNFGSDAMAEFHGTLLTTLRVSRIILRIHPERDDQRVSRKIAEIMRQLGWEQKTVRTRNAGYARAWLRKTPPEGVQVPLAPSEEEIPF